MRPLWTVSCTVCGERKSLSAKGKIALGAEVCIILYGISSVNAASNRRARGVIGVQRIDERQHIADRALALGRSAPRLLLMPALCALSGRLFLLRRLLRKGGAGRCRVMHPVCVVARYVAETLRQAPEADVLVVIAANGRRCVKPANEKTAFRMNDLSMTSFAVVKHEPHLPFRYGSIIAGAVYNNTDSWGYADTGTPETQKNRLKRRFFDGRWSE